MRRKITQRKFLFVCLGCNGYRRDPLGKEKCPPFAAVILLLQGNNRLGARLPASELIPDVGVCTVSMISDEHRIEARQTLAAGNPRRIDP